MRKNKLELIISTLLVVIFAAAIAQAGGPLIMWNAENRVPYRYDVTSPVPVYTDLGPFEIVPAPHVPISNETADSIVAFGFQQWTNVATSSFQAQVVGDFGSIGLPDINNAATAPLVFGTFNGGGIHVVYDADASILRDYFGAPPSVLGIASPEFADEATGTITESWVIINAQQRWVGDDQLLNYAGVFTHEFGHAINLAHSQTNGAIGFYGDARGPAACADALPYPTTLTVNDVETMYPFINARPGTGSGLAQSTVDRTDDKAALSNLYPAPDYPNTHGSISGKILQTDGRAGITGVNVIARNLDDPYGDAVSAMSGDYVRVAAGNDGSFTLTGLTPGARYALYTDVIVAGGFPTLQPFYIPGPEEFYNGANESGNALTDDRCQVEPITAVAGTTTEADITLNSVKGAPEFKVLGPQLSPTSMTSDGKVVVGVISNGPAFRWTEADGVEVLGNTKSTKATISRDGSTIVGETVDGNNRTVSSRLVDGSEWQPLPLPAGSAPCGTDASFSYGVADSGKAVSGYAYVAGCKPLPFLWTAATGTQFLPTPASVRQARPNTMSADGSTIVGWWVDGNGFGNRTGARWVNGQFIEFSTPEMVVGEATNTTPDGSVIVGRAAFSDQEAWRWTAAGGVQQIGRIAPFDVPGAYSVNDDGNVIVGIGGSQYEFNPLSRVAFLWTPELGMVDFQEFLRSQGTYFEGWTLNTASSISADGTTFTGGGFGPTAIGGWVIKMDKVNVCHAPPGNPSNAHTVNVEFPKGMQTHLDHGDTIGFCVDDGNQHRNN